MAMSTSLIYRSHVAPQTPETLGGTEVAGNVRPRRFVRPCSASRIHSGSEYSSCLKHMSVKETSRLAAAASRSGLYALALADLDGGLVVDGGGTHALLDLPSHGQESLLDVGSVFRRRLQEGDANAVGEFLQRR